MRVTWQFERGRNGPVRDSDCSCRFHNRVNLQSHKRLLSYDVPDFFLTYTALPLGVLIPTYTFCDSGASSAGRPDASRERLAGYGYRGHLKDWTSTEG